MCILSYCKNIKDKKARFCNYHNGESSKYILLFFTYPSTRLIPLPEQLHMSTILRTLGERRSRSTGNQQCHQSMTKKELEEFTVRVRHYMENDRFPIKPEYRQIRKLWQEKSSNLIVQDLEFVQRTKVAPFARKAIIEICWAWYEEESGTSETFQTIIDHGMSVRRMYDIYGSRNVNRGSLKKVYGEPSDNQTEGMTIEQVADRLEETVSDQEIWLAEWSNAFCDYNLVYDSLDAIGRASIMPPKSRAFSSLNAWRFSMIGIPVVFQLSTLHRIVIAYDSDLPDKRHRAKADALMTINLQDAFFKATLNALAPTGILRYFKAFKTYDVERDDDSGDLLLLKKTKDTAEGRINEED